MPFLAVFFFIIIIQVKDTRHIEKQHKKHQQTEKKRELIKAKTDVSKTHRFTET